VSIATVASCVWTALVSAVLSSPTQPDWGNQWDPDGVQADWGSQWDPNSIHLSRSQLFSRALDEFLERHESRMLLEAVNRALEGEPEPAEAERLRQMRGIQRRRVEGQW